MQKDNHLAKAWLVRPLSPIAMTIAIAFALIGTYPATVKAQPALVWPKPKLELVQDGLTSPVYLTQAGDDSGRLFIVEKGGTIRIFDQSGLHSEPFLDISDHVADDGEAGMLSVAFPPDFAEKQYFFVYYNHPDKNLVPSTEEGVPNDGYDSVIARFHVGDDPNKADPHSEERILLVQQPYTNHNGGQLLFGPDDYLYVALGDGGLGGDPHGYGQRLDTLLGKILRIEVAATGTYTVPTDNPFAGQAPARGEIWTYGMRNPWRLSFDRVTDDLYIGDVGQDLYEEVDFVPFAEAGGSNFGWKIHEGRSCFEGDFCVDPPGYVPPIWDYPHTGGNCSVTGGYVVRNRQPRMTGVYFYADYCSGGVWGLQRNQAGDWENQPLFTYDGNIASFGEDAAGELYLVDIGGKIYRIYDDVTAWPDELYLPAITNP